MKGIEIKMKKYSKKQIIISFIKLPFLILPYLIIKLLLYVIRKLIMRNIALYGVFIGGIYQADIVELKPTNLDDRHCYIEHYGKPNQITTCLYKD